MKKPGGYKRRSDRGEQRGPRKENEDNDKEEGKGRNIKGKRPAGLTSGKSFERFREKKDDKPKRLQSKKEGEGGSSRPKRVEDSRKSFADYRDRKQERPRSTGKSYQKSRGGDGYRKDRLDGKKPFRPAKNKNIGASDDGLIRLNKYIANSGICSRREADEYIRAGVVSVNGKVITEMGYKVKPGDRITFEGQTISNEKPVYILLNKPKDYITTSKDPQNRKTVLDLVSGIKERIYPVGRLDRNTTGLLLLTNDGLMAEKLMHPRRNVVKIYHVELDKKLKSSDLKTLQEGVELEDGFFQPDEVAWDAAKDKHHVGIEIHSGKNRIVRRLFEHLGYKVVKLDRVVYAGLTKKGLPRGEWRHLRSDEVNLLKMIV